MPGEDIYSWSPSATLNGNIDTSINWAEGQPRASVNNSSRAQMAAHAKQRDQQNGSIVTGGTADAQTFFSGNNYTTVPTGMRVLLKIGPSLTNTGAATLNMDNIGAVAIKNIRGGDIEEEQLVAGGLAEFIYNGTNWILLSFDLDLVTNITNTLIEVIEVPIATPTPALVFATGIDDAHDNYIFTFNAVDFDTSGNHLCVRLSIDGGATFIATPYYWYGATSVWSHGVPNGQFFGSGDLGGIWETSFFITGTVDGGASVTDGQVTLSRSAGLPLGLNAARWQSTNVTEANGMQMHTGGGMHGTIRAPFNAVQFFAATGNIVAGSIRMYGMAK